ncbi:MAG: hypothetical protein IJM62_06550 [Lachnospiraceae bacterium]|nr:hypothetical protein [Lachnospiraceae bacterium]
MFKRIVAVIGIIILVSLYIITLVVSLTGEELNMRYLMASVFATFFIPALMWAMMKLYEYLKNRKQ